MSCTSLVQSVENKWLKFVDDTMKIVKVMVQANSNRRFKALDTCYVKLSLKIVFI